MEPVVVRIGDRPLFVGDRGAGTGDRHDRSFSTVVSLTHDPVSLTTDHHPLYDGPGNDYGAFAAAVEDVRGGIDAPGATLVHCAAGVSRSATVLTTALAAEEDREFDDVLDEVRRHRPAADPHPALRYLAREYLGEDPDPGERAAHRREPAVDWPVGPDDGDAE